MKNKIIQLIKPYWWCLFLLLPIFFFLYKPKEKEEVLLPQVEPTISKTVKVDLKGAIKNPGLYELETGSRVEDAIRDAGGLTEEADTSMIHLSKLLEDEMVIIVYTKKEIESMIEGNTTIKYIDKECVCPSIKNDGCLEQNKTETNLPSSNNGKVSLNHASLEELMTLSGIGESKARAIIEYRKNVGLFKEIHEITKVDGIGEATFEKIKEFLTL